MPLPISALRSGSPGLRNPGNRNRAVPLTFEQFQFAFANAVSEEEAKQLYDTFCVPAPGEPPFQAAAAKLEPVDGRQGGHEEPEARADADHLGGTRPHGPLVDRERILQAREAQRWVTEIVKIPGRGHALTIDGGWREVADTALGFIKKRG